MGITDKISGRLKKAAGDLTGREALRREGAQEERKGEVKEQAAREQTRADQAQSRADRKADEVQQLERRTEPGGAAEGASQEELYEEAQALDIEGRGDMTKEQLAEAIRRAR
jgi:uncharacterized protein YjbJ (UPF0337 family)